MTLEEWVNDKGWNDKQAAHYFGMSRTVLNRIKNGVRTPTFEHAFRIWVGTSGRVGLKSWESEKRQLELAEEMKGRKP